MKKNLFACLIIFALIVGAAPVASGRSAGQSAAELKVGAPIERRLAGGEKHVYKIALKSGQWMKGVIDQRGIDVIIAVYSPENTRLAEIDSPNGDRGLEPILVTAKSSGEYRIEVYPVEEKAKPGLYEINIEQVRAAATTPSGKVDQLFALWDRPGSPGAAVAVLKDGQIVHKKGYGFANLEYDIPITHSTVFHVASVSKQFTAFAVAALAKEGKLSLDDDIRKHLPEVPDFGRKITVKNLIHHVSGLRDQWEMLAMAGWRLDDVITTEHILNMVSHQRELNFNPGDEYLYCNTGYTLLAEIAARVSGKSFRQYADETIFKPLGMTRTHFHDDHEMIVKDRAYSYAPAPGGGYKLSALNYATAGATSLFTTAEDLAKWAQNFYDARVGGPDLIERMQERGTLNNGEQISYAFGLVVGQNRGLKTISHSGGDAGYRSFILLVPEQKFAVVVLSNFAAFSPGQLAMQVAEVYLSDKMKSDAPQSQEPARKGMPVDAAILSQYAGMYRLASGFILTISVEDGQLMVQPADEPKLPAVAESDSRFLIPRQNSVIEFQKDSAGKVGHLIYRGIRAKRVLPFSPGPQELAEFAGEYYSPELGTAYTFEVVDGALIAKHRRTGQVRLRPVATDQFRGERFYFRNVVFARDEQNRIVGFRLTGGRVRNMRFDRRASREAAQDSRATGSS